MGDPHTSRPLGRPRPRAAAASPRRSRRTGAGFSIVEVIATAAILGIGIASSLIALTSNLRVIDHSRSVTLCSQILQSELERIRLLNWGQITALPAEETVTIESALGVARDAVTRFTLTRRVSTPVDKPADMRDVQLVVAWTGTFGTAHQRSYVTRYGRNGLNDYFYTIAR
jgi:type II secretory pathway pseudopilin PulG